MNSSYINPSSRNLTIAEVANPSLLSIPLRLLFGVSSATDGSELLSRFLT